MSELIFPQIEFEERFQRLTEQMAKSDLDAVILTRPESIFYACGYSASWIASWTAEFHGLIIRFDSPPRLVCRSLESKAAKQQWTKNPSLYADQQGPWFAVREILNGLSGKESKVGIEKGSLTIRQFEKIKEILPNSEFVEVSHLINHLIANPSTLEAEYITKAGEITERGFYRAIDVAKVGVNLYDVMAEIENSMYKAGQTEQDRSLCLIWAGPTGGAMHTTDITRKIQRNDLVTIEVWGTYRHYRAGAQGTLYVGTAPQEVLDTYRMVSQMYVAAKEKMRSGETTGAVFEAANNYYRSNVGSDYYRRIGGSMGLGSFIMNISKNGIDTLNPRMTFLVQPQTNDPFLITVSGTIMLDGSGNHEICRALLNLRTI